MLSTQDNELLCRVGPGTPMGEFMREYWLPAFVPSELLEADGEPRRMRLLGENLIAFRVSSGKYGLIANHCPHRGASLFFGRNEEEGLRCVYHGWKFDVTGKCLDMPSEPPDSHSRRCRRTLTRSDSGLTPSTDSCAVSCPATPMRNDLIRRSSCSGGTGKRTLTSRSIFAGSQSASRSLSNIGMGGSTSSRSRLS